ncbi:hypothetical protein ACFO26_10565 [Lactococcus nasutitermitis]|uniref:Uncharacterized protein n=1 Tax=Lactococcus nasutitermitis TaxID=1652957 RepID=A0ABV9JIX6_9LACT|nr:hypothetical protein [Lactococcus nasutitermitis]
MSFSLTLIALRAAIIAILLPLALPTNSGRTILGLAILRALAHSNANKYFTN